MASIKSKRGSYIMEAALVLPIIILTVITTVFIIMFFYSQATEQSRLHIALRYEAGMIAEKSVSFTDTERDAEFYTKKWAIGGKAFGKKYLIMPYKGMLRKKGAFSLEGSCYGTDGPKYVRYCNLVKDDREHEKNTE